MTKPKDVEVTALVLAEWIGVGTPAVNDYGRRGVTVRAPTRGKFFLKESVGGYLAHMGKVAVERENPTTAERTRLLRTEADGVEHKVKALQARLLPASSVAATWLDMKHSIRAKLLELPGRIDRRLQGRLSKHDLDVIEREVLLALKPLEDGPKGAAGNA
jgi:phage terminase Nu1 subunit (DNA packaging protein)